MLAPARNKKIKKLAFFLPVLTLFLVSGILYPQPVSAGYIWDFVFNTASGVVMKGLLYMVFEGVGILLSGAVAIFSYAVDTGTYGPDGLFNRQSVYAMWKFIRDFLNLFFILTLLYTAFTIVFQIAGNYKKTLLSIVLAALFVNFSFPISRVMIDLSNVPMYYFIELTMGTNVDGTTAQSALGPALSASGLEGILVLDDLWLSSVSQIFMGIIFMFVFMVTIMVLAVMLTIRMMMLLVLVMFSSIGFAGSIIPGMKKYSDMWWDSFAKNALFGPAAMLMLFVATRLFQEIAADDTNQKIAENMSPDVVQSASSLFGSMGMYAITIIMLWIAIGLANSMSIVGASAVTGKGQQFLKWAGRKSTVSPAMWAGRKVDSKLAGTKYGQYLSPGAWRAAFKQRGEEQKHKDEQPIKQAAARRQDQLNDVFSRVSQAGSTVLEGGIMAWPGAVKTMFKEKGKDHTDHNFAQTQAQAGEYRKEISDVSTQSDYVINEMKAALDTKNTAKADASLQILAKNNDLNDMIMSLDAKRLAAYGITDVDENGKMIKRVDENGKAIVSSENMMLALQGILKESGEENAEVLAKRMMVIGDNATNSGNFAFGGMTKFDQKMNNGHGGFRVARRKGEKYIDNDGQEKIQTTDEQAEWAEGKIKNLESQKRQTTLHPDSLFTRTSKGFGDINGEVAKAIIGTFTSADVAQVDRSRDDLKQAIHDAYSNIDQSPQFKAQYETNEMFKNYVDAVVRMKRGKKKDADDTSNSKSQWYKDNGPGTKYNEPAPASPTAPPLKFPDVPTA